MKAGKVKQICFGIIYLYGEYILIVYFLSIISLLFTQASFSYSGFSYQKWTFSCNRRYLYSILYRYSDQHSVCSGRDFFWTSRTLARSPL